MICARQGSMESIWGKRGRSPASAGSEVEMMRKELELMRVEHGKMMEHFERMRKWYALLSRDLSTVEEDVRALKSRMDVVEPQEVEDFQAIRLLRDRVNKLESATKG